jgi:hypothetical protein
MATEYDVLRSLLNRPDMPRRRINRPADFRRLLSVLRARVSRLRLTDFLRHHRPTA